MRAPGRPGHLGGAAAVVARDVLLVLANEADTGVLFDGAALPVLDSAAREVLALDSLFARVDTVAVIPRAVDAIRTGERAVESLLIPGVRGLTKAKGVRHGEVGTFPRASEELHFFQMWGKSAGPYEKDGGSS